MAQVLTDRRDIDFVLYEQFDVEEFTRHEKFQDYNKKTFDLIIKEARNLAVKEILPTYAEGDREGVKLCQRSTAGKRPGKTGRPGCAPGADHPAPGRAAHADGNENSH